MKVAQFTYTHCTCDTLCTQARSSVEIGKPGKPSKMPRRKISLSMKRAIVLNKGKTDELQRRVNHLRKSRDETLMELKAERLRLEIKKINDNREEATRREAKADEIKTLRKLSLVDGHFVQHERPKTLLPPLAKGFNRNLFASLSEPSTPTSTLEHKNQKEVKIKDFDSAPLHHSFRKSKFLQGKSSSFDEATESKGQLFGRSKRLDHCRKAWSDTKIEAELASLQGRKQSRSDFDGKYSKYRMTRDSTICTSKRFETKSPYDDNNVVKSDIACDDRAGFPNLVDNFEHLARHKISDKFKTV